MTEPARLDAYPGSDSHKSWDIFPPAHLPVRDYLLTIFSRGDESEEDTLRRIASWPSSKRGAPDDVMQLLAPYREEEEE